eukprot:scaffold83076_cov33-Attheya_sp.AAC.2
MGNLEFGTCLIGEMRPRERNMISQLVFSARRHCPTLIHSSPEPPPYFPRRRGWKWDPDLVGRAEIPRISYNQYCCLVEIQPTASAKDDRPEATEEERSLQHDETTGTTAAQTKTTRRLCVDPTIA